MFKYNAQENKLVERPFEPVIESEEDYQTALYEAKHELPVTPRKMREIDCHESCKGLWKDGQLVEERELGYKLQALSYDEKTWEDVHGFTESQLNYIKRPIRKVAFPKSSEPVEQRTFTLKEVLGIVADLRKVDENGMWEYGIPQYFKEKFNQDINSLQ